MLSSDGYEKGFNDHLVLKNNDALEVVGEVQNSGKENADKENASEENTGEVGVEAAADQGLRAGR